MNEPPAGPPSRPPTGHRTAPPTVHVDRLALRLPAGFTTRAAPIARLVAGELASALRHRQPRPGWQPVPVHVQAAPHEPDSAIAARIADQLTQEWR